VGFIHRIDGNVFEEAKASGAMSIAELRIWMLKLRSTHEPASSKSRNRSGPTLYSSGRPDTQVLNRPSSRQQQHVDSPPLHFEDSADDKFVLKVSQRLHIEPTG